VKHLARLSLIATCATLLVFLAVGAVTAHTVKKVGPYTLEIGWQHEPTYVGEANGVQVIVTDASHQAITDLTRAIPFNDAAALASVLGKLEGRVAALIMEPAMMNINIIPPVEGYLEEVRRLTAEHGVVLIFDEVKTGATISPGGATQCFGVTPDVITLAKAICGGLPGGLPLFLRFDLRHATAPMSANR